MADGLELGPSVRLTCPGGCQACTASARHGPWPCRLCVCLSTSIVTLSSVSCLGLSISTMTCRSRLHPGWRELPAAPAAVLVLAWLGSLQQPPCQAAALCFVFCLPQCSANAN